MGKLVILFSILLSFQVHARCFWSYEPVVDLSGAKSTVGQVLSDLRICHNGKASGCYRTGRRVGRSSELNCGGVYVMSRYDSRGYFKGYKINGENCKKRKVARKHYLKQRVFRKMCEQSFEQQQQRRATLGAS